MDGDSPCKTALAPDKDLWLLAGNGTGCRPTTPELWTVGCSGYKIHRQHPHMRALEEPDFQSRSPFPNVRLPEVTGAPIEASWVRVVGILLYPTVQHRPPESIEVQGHVIRWETIGLHLPWEVIGTPCCKLRFLLWSLKLCTFELEYTAFENVDLGQRTYRTRV